MVTDGTGLVVRANAALAAMFGLPRERIIGRLVREIATDVERCATIISPPFIALPSGRV